MIVSKGKLKHVYRFVFCFFFKTARLRKVIDVMLKTDQVPEAKTLIQVSKSVI